MNINYQNEKILKILEEFDNLNFKVSKNFGDINALSISAIELSKYISSAILNKSSKNKKKTNLPFANSETLKKNIKFKQKQLHISNKIFNFKDKLISNFKKIDVSTFRVDSKIYPEFLEELRKKNIEVKKIHFKPIYLDELNKQFEKIYEFLDAFKLKEKIKNKYFSENFINYLKYYFTNKKSFTNNSRYLLVGSNSIFENRIMSANYMLNKHKVISFNHANYSPLVYGEPLQELGEFSFSNFYINCGNLNFKKKYFKSNYFHPKIFNCNFYENTIEKEIKNTKIIFTPDSFHGNYRHGPWRDMEDIEYYNFQKKILSFDKTIKIKPHPKQRYENLSLKTKHKKNDLIFGPISNFLNIKNTFIIDRLSQVFFTVADTNSKIIFLDLGVRMIKKEVLKLLKKRTVYIKITPKNLDKIRFNKLLKQKIIPNKSIIKKCVQSKNNVRDLVRKLF